MKDNKYTVAIIDDETICINNFQSSIAEYSEFEVVGSAQSPIQGKELIMRQQPDLLFLDVEMPKQTGFDLLNEISDQVNWPMRVVFYTAYEKYLLEAIRASAFDYLLKPYQNNEFTTVINRFLNQRNTEKTQHSFRDTLLQLFPTDRPFMIPTTNGYKMLRKEQIGYFEYQKERKQWIVVLSDMSNLELKYDTHADNILNHTSAFVQISKRHIINIDYLSSIEGKDCILFPPFDRDSRLYVSRNYLKSIQERFETI
jgi:two-component system LytT family response regulator